MYNQAIGRVGMGKLHKIRKAWNSLTDEQKQDGAHRSATVVNGEVKWVYCDLAFFIAGHPHHNFIAKLRREYLEGVAHSD